MSKNNNNERRSEAVKEIRCSCKQLLARLSLRGLEFKCKRCKKLVVLPWPEFQVHNAS